MRVIMTVYDVGYLGPRPKVRRRLRSRKMALWRDLIPRLHRADDFDSRLHHLDDYDNETTFDESGTRLVPPPPSHWERYPSTSPSTTQPPVLASDPATWPGSSAGHGRTSSTAGTVAATSSPLTSMPATESGELAASSQGDDEDDHSTLFKTAAVGCALLALNVLVFTAVMCQWRGLRRTRLIELQKYASGVVVGGGGGIVPGVPCPSAAAAAGDTSDRVVATYTASPEGRCESAPPSPTAAATVLTPGECTCNNVGVDGGPGLSGILLTAPNNYYTYSSTANHVADYVNQRTTSTV